MIIEVASVQIQSELGSKASNVEKMLLHIRRVKEFNPNINLIVFPECALTGYECPELYPALAEPYPEGESLKILSQAAREHQVHLIFGFIEYAIKGTVTNLYNSAVLIDAHGCFCGRYRKTHLVDGWESSILKKGNSFPVFNTAIGKIGIMICWDSAFPEVARLLTLHGAELIVVPEAVEKGIERQWALILAARAFDNGAYVLSCNHVGQDRVLKYFGQSSLISPSGELIIQLDENEDVFVTTIDYELVRENRSYFYMLRQRRPDIYNDLCKQM